jgi:hypothetical protein
MLVGGLECVGLGAAFVFVPMKLNDDDDDGNDDKDRRNMSGTVLRVPQASRAMAISRTKFAFPRFLE